jgi:hypothetical protein
MPGLVPGIHVFLPASIVFKQDVDGRDKPGHDVGWASFHPINCRSQRALT